VCGRQPVTALKRARSRIVNLDEPARGVVLQPLAHVPLDGSGTHRQLRRRYRITVIHRPVEAEPLAEIDGEQLQRAERVTEEPVGECLGRVVHKQRIVRGRPVRQLRPAGQS
jgi:hypothetical protein